MDKVLKQRLVGASILIALAVIFLPMLFDRGDGELHEQHERALDLPERASGDRQIRRLPLDPDQARSGRAASRAEPPARDGSDDPLTEARPEARSPAQATASRSPAARQDQARPDDERAPEVPAPGPAGPPADAPAPASADDSQSAPSASAAAAADETPPGASEPAPAATAEGRWVVQVAVFSSRDTASSIEQRLRDLGHAAHLDVLVRDQAELFRLRAGPYADKDAAQRARQQISATVAGVDPVVRELSADRAADTRQGLAVQVGSFASRGNAERLVEQLVAANYDAFMHGEETGGRTIWRVRVGVMEQRADAERLLERLRDDQSLEGIVVSHP